MTEREWRRAKSPYLMLEFLERRAGARKMRLFGIACCRRIWKLCEDPEFRQTVELAERWVEGAVPEQEVAERRARMKALHLETYATADESRESHFTFWARSAARGLLQDPEEYARQAPIYPGDADLQTVWSDAASTVGHYYADELPEELEDEETAQAALLREVVGNPINPPVFDPAWRTAEVVQLARAMDAEQDFERMPELGKALRSAGCREKALLDHCKGDGPHVRGCWVVDLVLERE